MFDGYYPFILQLKFAEEFGETKTLYSARFENGYQTCFYADPEKAIAAGLRRAESIERKNRLVL